MRWAIAALCSMTAIANADDEFANGSVIFARGNQLIRLEPKSKAEVELATFGDAAKPAKSAKPGKNAVVRSLAIDAAANVLLVNLDGSWQWMPLDGSAKSLTALPCAEGAATLAQEGDFVLCHAKEGGSLILQLRTKKSVRVEAPSGRITGSGAGRKLVWADKDGVWGAPLGNRKAVKKLAPEAPKRGFLVSPDGTRAMGTYNDEVYVDVHHKQPAEILMSFALDGEGARRKAIKSGVPVEWSQDSQWVLVQDASNACLMHATGGEYKCWSGYTAVSISPDGKNALLLGKRDRYDRQPTKKGRGRKDPVPAPAPAPVPEEAEDGDVTTDPVVALPSGPLSLYRAKLEGSAFTETPGVIAKIVDGAAVWIPPRDSSD